MTSTGAYGAHSTEVHPRYQFAIEERGHAMAHLDGFHVVLLVIGGRLGAGIGVRLGVLGLVLLSGCEPKAAPPAPPPPTVSAVTVQAQAVPITTELPGRVAGYRTADVRPQVNGIILKRLFIEGGDVRAGQQLCSVHHILVNELTEP
jgi:hypothetical protein